MQSSVNKPAPWTEIIDTVVSVRDGEITLLCKRKVTLKADGMALAKWIHLLQPRRAVAILMLEDGGIRVRELDAGRCS